jgi:CBS domain-containing protein
MAKALELFGLGVRHLVVTGPFPAPKAAGGADDAAEEKAAVGDESTLRVLSQIDFVQGLLNVYLSNSLKNLDDHATVSSVFAQTAAEAKDLKADGSGAGKSGAVLTVTESESVLMALLHLVENGYNAAPVVDADGRVVGTIGSETVLRLLGDDDKIDLTFLDQPVKSLLRGRAKAVSCGLQTDLAQIANKMLDEHVHRVWVCVDEKPVAVVSCSDVIFAVGGEDAVMEDAAAQ